MMSVSVAIDEAAVARLDALMQRIATEMPERLANELQRAGIYICKALRARTKKAPVRIPRADIRWGRSDPQYIMGSKGKAKGKLLRRTVVNRYRKGVKGNIVKWKLLDGDPRTTRATSADLSAAWKRFGSITRHGLAKKSWGWVAQGIYNGGAAGMGDLSWRKAKHDRRDPRDSVRGIFRQHSAGASVELLNRLDYALDALPPAALNEGITAAVNRLEHNINHHLERVVK